MVKLHTGAVLCYCSRCNCLSAYSPYSANGELKNRSCEISSMCGIYIYIYTHVCAYVYIYIRIPLCVYIHTYIFTHVYIHTCINKKCIYIYICIHLYIYIYSYIYIYGERERDRHRDRDRSPDPVAVGPGFLQTGWGGGGRQNIKSRLLPPAPPTSTASPRHHDI